MPRQKCYVSDTNEAPIYDAAYIYTGKNRIMLKHNSICA